MENMMGSIMENVTENVDEIVDNTKGNSKKNVGGGCRKIRQVPLKEKGKDLLKLQVSLQAFMKNSWMIMNNKVYNLAPQRKKGNQILSSEEEITRSSKEKKTSRKRKRSKDVKQGELFSNDEDKPDSKELKKSRKSSKKVVRKGRNKRKEKRVVDMQKMTLLMKLKVELTF